MPGGIDPTRRSSSTPSSGVVRPMFRSLAIAASGLSAQRQRIETIAQNIANMDVTRGPDGGPYKRRDVVLETATAKSALYPGTEPSRAPITRGGSAGGGISGIGGDTVPMSDGPRAIEVPVLETSGRGEDAGGEYGVRIAGIAEDHGEGRDVYDPGHPDADANGIVRYPNVDKTMETVRLMEARRIYEANASVFQTVKSMLRASLDI